jgi:hypothetical protein
VENIVFRKRPKKEQAKNGNNVNTQTKPRIFIIITILIRHGL